MLLSKQSQKTYRIATGKNKQEEKRLALEYKLLEKNADFEDTVWLRELIKLKKSLADIRFKCDYETLDKDESYSRTTTTRSAPSAAISRTAKSAPMQQHKRSMSSSMATAARKTKRPQTGVKSAPVRSLNARSAHHVASARTTNENRRQSLLTRYTNPITNNTSNRYLLFPGRMLKSYTSLVGAEYDKSGDELAKCSINNMLLDNYIETERGKSADTLVSRLCLLSAASKKAAVLETNKLDNNNNTNKKSYEDLFSIEESTTARDDDEDDDDELNVVTDSSDDDNEYDDFDSSYYRNHEENTEKGKGSLLAEDLNEKYKSIRRSQAKSGSAKHVVFQMKSLKAKTQFGHEMNEKMNRFDDRNVRYGDPLPQRPLYRELRILSKTFEIPNHGFF